MKPTYEIAMAAGRDAGNRSMKAGNRTAWNMDDWNASCETFEKIMALVESSESQGI